jgi:poly(3-hydroxybutyrate) depolymerase
MPYPRPHLRASRYIAVVCGILALGYTIVYGLLGLGSAAGHAQAVLPFDPYNLTQNSLFPFVPFNVTQNTVFPPGASNASPNTASSLGAYNVNPNTVTVGGISSGGFMAVQLQVAYSTRIFGTAVFAGGPYYCAQSSVSLALGQCESGNGISLQASVRYTNIQNGNGTIDPPSNLANKPIYMFSGTEDTTVHQAVMDTLSQYYLNYTSSSNIAYDNNTPAAHAWISPDGPNSCTSSTVPYINDCAIDPEQTFLTMFYGPLSAKNTGTLGGSYIQFSQGAFVAGGNAQGESMDSTGWLYVPAACASGQACRLLIALHGCLQYQGMIQQQFVQKSGLNEWADMNNIIVLYPQATSSSSNPSNPLGCWDWWGYNSPDYALKSAPQMAAIMAMVSQITSGQR